ncbi:hypothetical protein MYCTH_2313737 [Thermothelomyces thermophilus ATCC 42464]|uniref:Uncharacterized protein n=1 Tax=Thermothelomyces thermophilus (strain ATCC 42464 / BCRC 31852 / DSM 1799) TaxID=573729 RepID=G2Q2C5_THET4|nr:uncharacterized protein MYCTH_2313737 [Thermothelomyces thermophilus ATCC 42464]AEO54250.1 hypothetical protein MYCTH_2313737 [Thermothelomyces thermophilus ATCC 42464]
MQTTGFQSIRARLLPRSLRGSLRRSMSSSTTSSRASSTDVASFTSLASSPVSVINSIVFRQKSVLESYDEAERPPHILEPRPIAPFGSVEQRLFM